MNVETCSYLGRMFSCFSGHWSFHISSFLVFLNLLMVTCTIFIIATLIRIFCCCSKVNIREMAESQVIFLRLTYELRKKGGDKSFLEVAHFCKTFM